MKSKNDQSEIEISISGTSGCIAATDECATALCSDEVRATASPLHIDVESVINTRLKRYRRFIPRPLIRWVERTICQDQLNGILERTAGTTGAEFCDGVLRDLNVTYSAEGVAPDPKQSRVIIVCNHPLGALDGITMIHWATATYGRKVYFIVNDILTAIKPLNDTFLPVNLYGRQSRKSSIDIEKVFESDSPIIMFPAGLVSRKQPDGTIADLKWHKMFVNKAIEYRRDVIPVYFDALNSPFFYNFAKFRSKLGIRFNFEMIYLPREIFRSRNARMRLIAGSPIAWSSLEGGRMASATAQKIKQILYSLLQKSTK